LSLSVDAKVLLQPLSISSVSISKYPLVCVVCGKMSHSEIPDKLINRILALIGESSDAR